VPLAKGISSEIIKQVRKFHAEKAPSAASEDKADNSLLNAQLHLQLPARIPKSHG